MHGTHTVSQYDTQSASVSMYCHISIRIADPYIIATNSYFYKNSMIALTSLYGCFILFPGLQCIKIETS